MGSTRLWFVLFLCISYCSDTNQSELMQIHHIVYCTILKYIYCIFENIFGFYFAKSLENILKNCLVSRLFWG